MGNGVNEVRSPYHVSRFRKGLFGALALSLAVAGCSTDPDWRLFTVEYALTVQGEGGNIARLTYDNGRGLEIVVSLPADDWSTEFEIPDEGLVRGSVDAIVRDGGITYSVTVREGRQTLIDLSDSCSDNSGVDVDCPLTIPIRRFP